MYKKFYPALLNKSVDQATALKMAEYILDENTSPVEISSLLTAINFHGYTHEIITGFSKTMKSLASPVEHIENLIDVCGTGGDGHDTFNISTATSILVSAFTPVAKHGNGSVSSKCGSADVIKALSIPCSKRTEDYNSQIKDKNYSFIFAPFVHPCMKHIMPIRRSLGIPTIFNVIGPLCNPYDLAYQVVGVFKKELMSPIAKSLRSLGLKRAAVVHGHLGLDELSTTGPNHVLLIEDNNITEIIVDPQDFNIDYASLSDLKGGDTKENVHLLEETLKGSLKEKSEVVALNAALALTISGQTSNLTQGYNMAIHSIKDGTAYEKLKSIREVS